MQAIMNGHRQGARRAAYPARYSALGLLRRGLTHTEWPPAWRPHPLKGSYDVVIVGGGVHGLAAAYYLAANHGITDVAVLDKGYMGSGGSGRNTAILRSNYLTPEGVRFYDRSIQLYRRLAADLDFNVMFSRRGHLTLAHSDSSLRTMRWRAEVNKAQGVDSEVIGPAEVKRLAPFLDVSDPAPGIRCSARCGTRRAASSGTTPWSGVTPAARTRSACTSTRTPRSPASTSRTGGSAGCGRAAATSPRPVVLNATAGWSTLISGMAGVAMPIQTFPLQAAVTEPVKPFLSTVIVSGTLHVYISQTDRGELVFGASVDPFTSYSMRGSLEFIEGLAGHVLELMPALTKVRVLRQWAGLCDMTPDFSPVMGHTPVEGFLVDVGLGHLRVQGRAGVRRGDGAVHRDPARPRRSSPPSAWNASPRARWWARRARPPSVTDV